MRTVFGQLARRSWRWRTPALVLLRTVAISDSPVSPLRSPACVPASARATGSILSVSETARFGKYSEFQYYEYLQLTTQVSDHVKESREFSAVPHATQIPKRRKESFKNNLKLQFVFFEQFFRFISDN